MAQTQETLFEFYPNCNTGNWRIVDDVVMGGQSKGRFFVNNAGNGIFTGHVSLENNGGFSMLQYRFGTKKVSGHSKVAIKLKGDGKTYQFRIKSQSDDYYWYVKPFKTSGNWQTIFIPFNSMQPAFRGQKLDAENYPGKHAETIAFLIANKKNESFRLEINSIVLH